MEVLTPYATPLRAHCFDKSQPKDLRRADEGGWQNLLFLRPAGEEIDAHQQIAKLLAAADQQWVHC